VRLGEAYVLADRLEDALEVAGRALTSPASAVSAPAKRRPSASSARSPPAAIPRSMLTNHYHNSLALAEELGMRPLVAHCHAGLAKLYRRTGKRSKSGGHFTTATTMYREMGMNVLAGKGGGRARVG